MHCFFFCMTRLVSLQCIDKYGEIFLKFLFGDKCCYLIILTKKIEHWFLPGTEHGLSPQFVQHWRRNAPAPSPCSPSPLLLSEHPFCSKRKMWKYRESESGEKLLFLPQLCSRRRIKRLKSISDAQCIHLHLSHLRERFFFNIFMNFFSFSCELGTL